MRITFSIPILVLTLSFSAVATAQETFSDTFSSVSYSNNDGTENFAGNWIEDNESTDPDSGRIEIVSNELEFRNLDDRSISRALDLSGAASAVLTLNYDRTSGNEELLVQLFDGSLYNTVATLDGTGTVSYTLATNEMSASSSIRFITGSGNWGNSETIYVDNVLFTVTFPVLTDTDNDGVYDDSDLDSDNDGIPDLDEGDCAAILNNSSTESPLLSGSTPFLTSFDSGNIKIYNASNVPFWETTATDNAIEIWNNSNTFSSPHIDAHSGTQFMELNANEVASSYQDVATTPGTTISWSIAHRGRSGTEDATVSIGAPGAVSVVETMSTDNTAWVIYSGTYTIPAGQSTTRFQFDSLGGGSSGNFIDTFTIDCIVASDKDGDGIYDYLDLDSDNDGIFDIVESGALNETNVQDLNNDGTIDGIASDFGSNGLFSAIENNDTTAASLTYTPNDADSDGALDTIETDADNDSCNDVIEAGFTDDNDDGLLGPLPVTVDANGKVTSGSDGYTTPNDNDSNTTYDFQETGATPSISSQPVNVTTCPGCTTNITVSTTGDTLQWQLFNGSTWDDLTDTGIYSGTTTATLTITNPTPGEHNNQYRVVVSDLAYVCASTNSNSAILSIRVSTVITNRRITLRVNRN